MTTAVKKKSLFLCFDYVTMINIVLSIFNCQPLLEPEWLISDSVLYFWISLCSLFVHIWILAAFPCSLVLPWPSLNSLQKRWLLLAAPSLPAPTLGPPLCLHISSHLQSKLSAGLDTETGAVFCFLSEPLMPPHIPPIWLGFVVCSHAWGWFCSFSMWSISFAMKYWPGIAFTSFQCSVYPQVFDPWGLLDLSASTGAALVFLAFRLMPPARFAASPRSPLSLTSVFNRCSELALYSYI